MGRKQRKNDSDWFTPVAQLAGLLVVVMIFVPQLGTLIFRSAMFLVVAVFVISAIVLTVVMITQRRTRGSPTDSTTAQVVVPTIPPPVAPPPRISPPPVNIMEKIRTIDWFQFECMVQVLYKKRGYVVTRRGGAKADGGIDLILEKDGRRTAVQCKHWKTWNVGVKAVREFVGALTDAQIEHGIFITLGGYTGDARQLADKHRIEMINETDLQRMLEASDAHFDPALIAALNDKRKYCPKCESQMELRTARKGPQVGGQFWGCSTYPRCRFTMSLNA